MVTVLAVVCVNIYLSSENRDLDKQLRLVRDSMGPPVGMLFPSLSGQDVNGHLLTVLPPPSLPARNFSRTLVLVLSPSCPICRENWPAWHRLLNQDSPAVNVIILDLSGALDMEYANANGISQRQVWTKIDELTKCRLNLHITPQTVILGSDNRVMGTYSGMLTSAAETAILRSLTKS